MRWLERNIFINQLKLDDSFDFMANPYFVMNNSDQNERIKEWNRRCDLYTQRYNRLRHQKHLRELKKTSSNPKFLKKIAPTRRQGFFRCQNKIFLLERVGKVEK